MRGLVFYANYSLQTRAARPPLFCRFTHSVTGLPRIFRKVSSTGAIRLLQKQKNGLLCNFFAIADSLLFPRSENSPSYGQFTAFSSRYSHFVALRQSAIAKKLQPGPIFCFQPPKHHWADAISGGETDVAPRDGNWSDLHSGGPYRSCWN